MSLARTFGGVSVAIGMMTAPAAWADVTADQVWIDFKDYMEGFGYSITADEAQDGDTLTVTGIRMTMEMPEDAGTATFGVPDMTFTDNGDGTVDVTLPEMSTVDFSVDAKDEDEDVSGQVTFEQTDFAMTVSGEPGDLVYDYSAKTMRGMLAALTVEDEPVQIDTAQVTVDDMDGESSVKVDDLRRVAQRMTMGALSYDLDMVSPEQDEGRVTMNGELTSPVYDGTFAMPLDPVGSDDPNAMIEAGLAVDGGFTHSGGKTEFRFAGDGDALEGTASSDSGELSVRMDAGQLGYTLGAKGLNLMAESADLPFPVELAMDESLLDFTVPVTPGDDPQDFGLSLTLGDFTMSDMIWQMFDPAGQLPRDPATVALDLNGKARLDAPLMASETMESDEAPGELHALNIADLVVRLAGAELTGKGDFTFDNNDTTTFDGMPRPEGALNLQLVGGNTLLDSLVNMGLLPEEQAMGARMMIGMFAVPGAGEDTLTSTIEVNEAGQVLANGQRLR